MTEEHLRRLLARGLVGDEPAYRIFLAELAAHLRTWLRGRVAQLAQEIEDLLQEILLAVHNQRHTYDPKQPLNPWVHAIVRYKIMDLLRRRSRNDMLNDPLDDDDQLFVAVNGDAAETRYDLAKLLDELPDRQRLPTLDLKIEGASVADAAKRTGMSESAVKVGFHRRLKSRSYAAQKSALLAARESERKANAINILAQDVYVIAMQKQTLSRQSLVQQVSYCPDEIAVSDM